MNVPDSSSKQLVGSETKSCRVLEQAARASLDYLEGAGRRPVAADTGADNTRWLHERLGGRLPDAGEDPETVIDRLAADRGVVASGGPSPPVRSGAELMMANASGRVVADADEIRRELLGTRRHDVLSLPDIARAGHAFFGDPEGMRLYNRPPSRWFSDGIRIAGRTCVEAAPDTSSGRIAQNVKQRLAREAGHGTVGVVDLFAGSGNLMFHLASAFDADCVGIEIDPLVYRLTVANFAALGSVTSRFRLGSWESYFDEPLRGVATTIFVIAPPWGDAFSFRDGLDLRRTTPPVLEVLRRISRTATTDAYAVVQVPTHETVNADSLNEILADYRMIATAPACLLVALD